MISSSNEAAKRQLTLPFLATEGVESFDLSEHETYTEPNSLTPEEVMKTTKQKRRYVITLPPEAIAVLRWHVDTHLARPEQQDSELLFPAVNGKFRSPCVLNKPLDEVGLELGLKKRITQRALRRTFNDLARAAQVNADAAALLDRERRRDDRRAPGRPERHDVSLSDVRC